MRILYGVSGEGLGHASHALEIASVLEKEGHEVLIMTHGQAHNLLKDRFRVIKVHGFCVVYENGVLNYSKSLISNLKVYGKNILSVKKLHNLVKSFKPDLCVTDMEPVVPILSYAYKIPLISISNQERFTRFKINCPLRYRKDYFIAKSVIRMVVPKADRHIALSLSKLKKIKPNSFLVAPVIRKEIRNIKPSSQKFILVYLSKENGDVLSILKTINRKFVVYGYNIKKKEGNLEFKEKKSFLSDFASCEAIISTSGFTSVGEAIYLKKPYLAVPLKGQFEQVFNALFIKREGFGMHSDRLTRKQVTQFLENLPVYKKNLSKYKINLENPASVLLRVMKSLEKLNE
jgi:uncharacterized protein (TIGR00661 family)